MKAYEYDCVVYADEYYCVECLPKKISVGYVYPIFPNTEVRKYPVCCECGKVHDYMIRIGDD